MGPMQTPEAFVVGFNPVASATRVAKAQSQLKWSLWMALPYAALGVVYYWLGSGPGRMTTVISSLVVSFVIWVAFLIWRIVNLRVARAALSKVGAGEAFRISHSGLTLAATSEQIAWHDIAELKAVGRPAGAGPELQVKHRGGTYQVPLSFLDAMPGSIDSALRAYSGGRRGLDLGELDSVFSQ
jgi:hypothetical protein